MIFTKLYLPKIEEQVVHRLSLFEILRNGINKKVILVSATAGYGKTTLISDWINQHKITAAWCSLDNRDNDPFLFLNILITSVNKQESTVGQVSLELLQKPGSVSAEYILELFINDLLSLEKEIVLVLDDLHLIDNKQVFEILSTFIEYKPAQLQLILSTRSDPPLSFARLRSQNEILEIRSDKLSFTQDDIAYLFNKRLKLGLKQHDFAILEKKTEGWIAGLQLTALSLKGQGNVSEYLDKMAGDNRYIMDYLIEEVLHQQSEEEREFLLGTSILHRFNAELCNILLGIENSQEMMEGLERNNMFIVPLDHERNWFRYHHLFASLLKQRLEFKFKDRVPKLHNLASQWFEKDDQLLFALEHALAAGNKEKALDHFAHVIQNLWQTSQYQTILQFGGMFTHAELIKNVELCLNYFWILFQSGQMEKAARLITLLQKHTTDKAVLAMVYVCQNNLKVSAGTIESAYTHADLSLQHITENADYWNILALLSLGEVHLLRFELSESYESFDQAAIRASSPQHIYFEIINRTRASFVSGLMGESSRGYREGEDLLNKCKAAVENYGASIEFLFSMVSCFVGNFLINSNEVDDGLQKSVRGYELARKTTNPVLIASSTYLLAEAYYLTGEYPRAVDLLKELDDIPYKQASKFLCVLSNALKSKLYPLTNTQDKLKALLETDVQADKDHAFESIHHRIDRVRYQIFSGDLKVSISSLEEMIETLEQRKAYGLLADVELLMAKANFILNDQSAALEYMARALHRTQDAGLIRMYLPEGEEIEQLVNEIRTIKKTQSRRSLDAIDDQYIQTILRAFEEEKCRQPVFADEEELSSRESDTLQLLAKGLSNQEIAAKLFISNNTVKTHVRNILFKLEAKNRHEAVEFAKEKGLVP